MLGLGGLAVVAAVGAYLAVGTVETGPNPDEVRRAAPVAGQVEPVEPADAPVRPVGSAAPAGGADQAAAPANLEWKVGGEWPAGDLPDQQADDPAHQRFLEIASRSLDRQVEDYTAGYRDALSINVGGAQDRMVAALEEAIDEMTEIQRRVHDGELDPSQAFGDMATARKRAIGVVRASAGDADADRVLEAMGEDDPDQIIGWGVPMDDIEFGELFK